jgi:hypothetical protein
MSTRLRTLYTQLRKRYGDGPAAGSCRCGDRQLVKHLRGEEEEYLPPEPCPRCGGSLEPVCIVREIVVKTRAEAQYWLARSLEQAGVPRQ